MSKKNAVVISHRAMLRFYNRRYQRQRRQTRRAAGRCVDCARARKLGIAQNGERYSRCVNCIARHARHNARYVRLRRRRGLCRLCPRRRPPGDTHLECRRCRRRVALKQRRRKAART